MLEFLPACGLLALSACFSGAEAALFTVAAERRPGPRLPPFLMPLLEDGIGALATILCSNLIINLSYFALVHHLGANLSLTQAALLTTASVMLLVILGEILPKVLAHRYAEPMARLLLPPVRLMHLVLAPILRPLAKRLERPISPQEPLASGQTVTLLSGEGELGISTAEQTLLAQLLELGHLRAGALRRPLNEVPKLAMGMRLEAALSQLRAQGVAAAAVVDRAGVIRGVFDRGRQPRGQFVADAMVPLPILPEVAPVANGIHMLIESGLPFILLVDEYGDDAGIIERGRWADTLLDRLPNQGAAGQAAVEALGPHAWELDAALPLHDVVDRFGDLGPHDVRVDTLGGLVLERLGRMAQVGDVLHLEGEQGEYRLSVLSCSSTRPLRLRLDWLPPRTTEGSSSASSAQEAPPEEEA